MRLSFATGLIAAAAVAALALAAAGLVSFDRVVIWIFEQQRAFHRALTDDLRSLANGNMVAGAALIAASFLYGVFHAAGPGHGKAVLTTYLLTRPDQRARGVRLAVAAAFCQGLTAIALVYGLVVLAGWLPRETTDAATWAERSSYALVMIVGALLAGRSALPLMSAALRAFQPRPALHAAAVVSGPRGQDHLHAHGRGHDRGHEHHHHAGCGHAHGPTAAQVAGATGLQAAVGVVLSIGLRPCSGAVLILVFAHAVGLDLAGIGAVAAMSVGTALATATLAVLAVHARRWADAVVADRWPGLRLLGGGVAVLGGAAIFAIGLSLLMASFAPRHPLGVG